MAIVIQNVSEKHGLTYGEGLQKYTLGINHDVLVPSVHHRYEDGLATLLRRCADALDDQERRRGRPAQSTRGEDSPNPHIGSPVESAYSADEVREIRRLLERGRPLVTSTKGINNRS